MLGIESYVASALIAYESPRWLCTPTNKIVASHADGNIKNGLLTEAASRHIKVECGW